MKKIVAVCLVAVAVSVSAGTFNTEDRFSVTLPAGWVRMPNDVLDSYAASLDEASPDESGQFFDYGFQLKDAGDWLAYPCILVQVNREGRFETGELARSAGEQSEVDMEKALLMEVRGQGDVKILVARQLTEYGFIELRGFASAEGFDEYEALFRQAFSGLRVDDPYGYKPQITDNAPVVGSINLGKVLVVGIQSAVVGAVLWLVYSLLRRKFKRA
jgi:hypothetical protein